MAVYLFRDLFTDANGTTLTAHTSDSGHSYSGDTAGWEIQDNRVITNNAAAQIAQVSGFTSPSEFDITVNARRVTGTGSTGIVVCATGDPSTSNGYLIQWFSGRVRILKWTSGGVGSILHDSVGYLAVVDGEDYPTCKLEVRDSGLTFYTGGVLRYTASETEYRGTGLYLRGANASTSTTGYHISDISMEPFPPPIDIPSGTLALTAVTPIFGGLVYPIGSYPVTVSANGGLDTDTGTLHVGSVGYIGENNTVAHTGELAETITPILRMRIGTAIDTSVASSFIESTTIPGTTVLTFSGIAPVLHTALPIPVGGLTVTGVAPTFTDILQVPSIGLTITGTAPTWAIPVIESVLNMTITDIPNGTYTIRLVNSANELFYTGNVLFNAGTGVTGTLAIAAGEYVTGYVLDNQSPNADGAVIVGTTV
jgi:hypothetical protein